MSEGCLRSPLICRKTIEQPVRALIQTKKVGTWMGFMENAVIHYRLISLHPVMVKYVVDVVVSWLKEGKAGGQTSLVSNGAGAPMVLMTSYWHVRTLVR